MKRRIECIIMGIVLSVSLLSPITAYAEDTASTENIVSENDTQEETGSKSEQPVTEDKTGADDNKDNKVDKKQPEKFETQKSTDDKEMQEKQAVNDQQKQVKSGYSIDMDNTTVDLSEDIIYYDGTPKIPKVTVSYQGEKLVENIDYILQYHNQTKAGAAYVDIEGIGKNYGIRRVYYLIIYDTNDMLVTLSQSKYVYDGKHKKPKIKVRLRSTNEDISDQCVISGYSGNVNAGTAYVKIVSNKYYLNVGSETYYGIYFEGTVKKAFTISRKKVNSKRVYVDDYTYNGKKRTPRVYGVDETYKRNKDYTIKYLTNHKKVGKHKIKITFKGNYTGTVTKSFKIFPETPKIKTKNKTDKSITVYWKKVKGASNYKIWKDGRVYKTTKKNSIKLPLDKNKSWMFYAVDSYAKKIGTSNKGKIHTAVFHQPRTTISLKRTDWGEVTVYITSYDKQYYNNYQFQMSNNKGFKSGWGKYVSTAKYSSRSMYWYNIPSGQKRYFRARQYWYTSSGRLKTGKWSKVKAVTVY